MIKDKHNHAFTYTQDFVQMYAEPRKYQTSGESHECSNSNTGEEFLEILTVDRIVVWGNKETSGLKEIIFLTICRIKYTISKKKNHTVQRITHVSLQVAIKL